LLDAALLPKHVFISHTLSHSLTHSLTHSLSLSRPLALSPSLPLILTPHKATHGPESVEMPRRGATCRHSMHTSKVSCRVCQKTNSVCRDCWSSI
jgi:hypothetical protein